MMENINKETPEWGQGSQIDRKIPIFKPILTTIPDI
jgi:hypothetical protein